MRSLSNLRHLRNLRMAFFLGVQTPMASDREQKLESLGYPLDRVPGVGAIYKPVVVDGTTVYTSGSVPFDGDRLASKGKVPSQVPLEDAKRAAALCAANVL